jgi:hypothetical protein
VSAPTTPVAPAVCPVCSSPLELRHRRATGEAFVCTDARCAAEWGRDELASLRIRPAPRATWTPRRVPTPVVEVEESAPTGCTWGDR